MTFILKHRELVVIAVLVLTNGLVATEDGANPGDVVIGNGVVAAVLPPGSGAARCWPGERRRRPRP